MRITGFEFRKLSIKLPQPLEISFHRFEYQDNYFLTLRSDSGLVGWGEAAPFKPITGDSADEVVGVMRSIATSQIPPLLSADQFFDDFVSALRCPTLRAAFDTAAHDLLGRARGMPVYRLYAAQPRAVPNCVTVFIQPSDGDSAEETRRILRTHRHLKFLKIKLAGRDDVRRCRAIRQVIDRPLRYVLDANQAFGDPAEAVAVLREIVAILGDVAGIEQPCPKDRNPDMKRVMERLPEATIFADESCAGEADLEQIIAGRCAGGVNIKLQKCGGITPARRMARRAGQAGLRVMLGEMFEDALGTAAAVHVAACTDNIEFTDLDMDLDLPRLWTGQTDFRDGCRHPLQLPGLGFEIDRQAIADMPAGLASLSDVYSDDAE